MVGWASGRASALQTLSVEVLVWLTVCSEVQIVCGPADATAISKSHHLLSHVKPRLVLPFSYRLTQVLLEKRPLNGRGCILPLLLPFNNSFPGKPKPGGTP